MAFPRQSDVEIPLLTVLAQNGGSAKPRDVYGQLAAHFPELTAVEQEQRIESSSSTRKWWNLVQWVRQYLVETGEIDGATRGVWTLTPRVMRDSQVALHLVGQATSLLTLLGCSLSET